MVVHGFENVPIREGVGRSDLQSARCALGVSSGNSSFVGRVRQRGLDVRIEIQRRALPRRAPLGRAGRSTGGVVRTDGLPSRRSQKHLRNGSLPHDEHGHPTRPLRSRTPHHGGLPPRTRRRRRLRPRGERLPLRFHPPLAPRSTRPHLLRRRLRNLRLGNLAQSGIVPRPRLLRPVLPPLERSGPRLHRRDDGRSSPRTHLSGGLGGGVLSNQRNFRCHFDGFGGGVAGLERRWGRDGQSVHDAVSGGYAGGGGGEAGGHGDDGVGGGVCGGVGGGGLEGFGRDRGPLGGGGEVRAEDGGGGEGEELEGVEEGRGAFA
mmetsp:Transcript_25708/g.53746  ORF Transcript_25708/g.53746 Transcript_25708/m.53746 type:complete len:319 (+) Transcript_25708:872-1828(+)